MTYKAKSEITSVFLEEQVLSIKGVDSRKSTEKETVRERDWSAHACAVHWPVILVMTSTVSETCFTVNFFILSSTAVHVN